MKFTLSWLKDHLETDTPLGHICDTLTMIGLEVEQVIDRGSELKPFTVAKIISATKHPEADKLQVCRVESDVGELQIVCGAANARAGIYVVLAKEGAVIPHGGMVIKKTKIRGVESSGMLCSAKELNLGGDSEGIIELSEAKIGESVVKLLGLDDPVIEIAITPNRADCLGVRGVARDLAAAGLGKLKLLPDTSGIKGKSPSPIKVSIADEKKCPQFIGCTIKGVKNGESPTWLKKRLEAIGQKSISALVDITNYITIDLGRPLHVFDTKKLRGNLTVRDAKEGEKLKALNGKDYILRGGMTVITDDSGALSLGGIIGGEASGCTEASTEVFLEVALFDAAHIAETGRTLQIDSDARYRFERGIDPDFVETGALLAIRLIKQLCGGEASELTITGKTPQWQRSFALLHNRIASLGGVTLPSAKVESILKALGFNCAAANGGWEVSPPSWRADIEGDADLVEEILRIHGYDHISATSLPILSASNKAPANRAQIAKRTLAQRGMLELCTWSFLPEAQAKMFGGTNPKLKLLNPISTDLDTMRPSLLPNLLEAAKKNAFRGFKDLSLFEAGLQFHDVTPDGQRMAIAGIHTGEARNYTAFTARVKTSRKAEKGDVEDKTSKLRTATLEAINVIQFPFLEAKSDAFAVLETLGVNTNNLNITTDIIPSWYHPGRSGVLMLGKTVLGYFGEIHPGLLRQYELEDLIPADAEEQVRVPAFEIFLDAIPQTRAKSKAKAPPKFSDFQSVERDFAFLVDEAVSVAIIKKTLEQADKQLITKVRIFDVYDGVNIPDGKKSIAVKVTLQAMDKTLTDVDIATVSQAIIAAAAKGFGGQLRQ